MGERKVFILLSNTGTYLNRMIKFVTGCPLNHASIAFDEELREVYSFGRKRPRNPFIGGFVKEDIRSGFFKDAQCAVFYYMVSDEEYNRMLEIVQQFEQKQHFYKYNFIGLFGVLFNLNIQRKRAFFCSQFVATVLAESSVAVVPKKPNFVSPQDFMESNQLQMIYAGSLSQYAS